MLVAWTLAAISNSMNNEVMVFLMFGECLKVVFNFEMKGYGSFSAMVNGSHFPLVVFFFKMFGELF